MKSAFSNSPQIKCTPLETRGGGGGGGGDGGEGSSSMITTHLCPSISGISGSDDRIGALYSPFRPRDLNPESYDLKMKFWMKGIEEWVHFGSTLSFTLPQLQKGLMIKGKNKTPACLEEVLQLAARDGTIVSESEFYDGLRASVSWASWSQVNVKRLMTKLLIPLPTAPWTLFYRRGHAPPEPRYVHLQHLKRIVDQVSKSPDLKNRLLSLTAFKELITGQTGICEPEDLTILLDYLSSKKLIEFDTVGSEDVVLFGDGVKGISDVDKGKYDVNRFIQINELRLEETHAKIDEALDNAKKALKGGRRATAKHELKKKKMLEARVDKLLNVLDSLTVISMRLEEAESDASILQAYKAGKTALSEVLQRNNLTTDSVTETMLDVQEVLEEQAEINASISVPLDQDSDLGELDAELEALMAEDAAGLAAEKEKRRQQEAREQEDELLRQLKGMKVREGEVDLEESRDLDRSRDEENVPSPSSQH